MRTVWPPLSHLAPTKGPRKADGGAGFCLVGGFLQRSQLSIFRGDAACPICGLLHFVTNHSLNQDLWAALGALSCRSTAHRIPTSPTKRAALAPRRSVGQTTAPPMSEAAAPKPQAAAAPSSRSRHVGVLDPRAVPCSLLGVKKVLSAATMGPASGEELVSPSKWLRAHEREPQLPQRESYPPSARCRCRQPPPQNRRPSIPARTAQTAPPSPASLDVCSQQARAQGAAQGSGAAP